MTEHLRKTECQESQFTELKNGRIHIKGIKSTVKI